MWRAAAIWVGIVLCACVACDEPAPAPGEVDGGIGLSDSGATSDGSASSDVTASADSSALTGEQLEMLRSLSFATSPPPPPDISNRVADDARAAEWGQQLFFDPGFSGQLLDSDNGRADNMEGMIHRSVGRQGESGKVSCASCHVPEDNFADTRTVHRQVSLAAGWTPRRSPSILDVGHASLLMWDGRIDSLQRQVLGVIESPLEANSSRLYFAQEIARRYSEVYQEIFGSDPSAVLGSDYPQLTGETTGCQLELTSRTTPDDTCSQGNLHGVPGDGAEYDSLTPEQQRIVTTIALNAGKAIAAYERLLTCGTSRFDEFAQGDPIALTDPEQRGAALFVGKANCVSCHSGPFFSDQQFHNVGLVPAMVAAAFITRDDPGAERGLSQVINDPLNVASEFSDGDDGRIPTEVPDGMLGAFRTPMLRCVSRRPSFMRTAQLRSLRDVVVFFNEGGTAPRDEPPPVNYLGRSELLPLGLTDEEIDDLVAFLEALDGPGPSAPLLESSTLP